MTYPSKDRTVDILLEVGRRGANELNSEHPEDISNAIARAVESAAVTLKVLVERGEIA